jgi:tetratricopeptide (TPR) repeat protein
MKAIWILVMLLLLLQGCSGMDRRERPAPVTDAGTTQPVKRPPPTRPAAPVEEQVEVYAYREEQAPAFAPNRPVLALVERAEAQRAAGDLAGASATLERALRIEPRNPHILNRLARVRLQQGNYSQADSLASKSNALAGSAPALERDNLSIIAAARKAAGR